MLKEKFFDDLTARFSELYAQSPAKDFEKNMRSVLASGFAKLDLVTREEFDVQAAVLARTREALNQVSERLAVLEAQRAASQSTDQ